MVRAALSLLLLTAVVVAAPVRAADWVLLSGTEEGRKGTLAPWGFAQALVESSPWSAPVVGLKAAPLQAFEGQHLAAEIDGPFDFTVRRARLGLRGEVPGTDGQLNVFVAVEAGQNGQTRARGVVLVDATATYAPWEALRLRVGQMKTPTADEALEANPVAAAFTRFSPFVQALLIEQDVKDGAIVGPVAGLRDVGVEAFGVVPLVDVDVFGGGVVDVTYAAMASLGRPWQQWGPLDGAVAGGVDAFAHAAAVGPDVTGRVQLSWVMDATKRARWDRDEVAVWGFVQHGTRAVDVDATPAVATVAELGRSREGFGGAVRFAGVRVRGEAVLAQGAMAVPGAFVGQAASFDGAGVAHGGSVDVDVARVGAFDLAPFVVSATYDWLARNPDDPVAARLLQSITLGTQVRLSQNFRLLGNVELRQQTAGAEAPPDAGTIASGLSPLVSAQLNLTF